MNRFDYIFFADDFNGSNYYSFCMDKRLELTFDENLKEVPKDLKGFKSYVVELEKRLNEVTDQEERVRLLGEFGTHLRVLGFFDRAAEVLKESLQIIQNQKLGIKLEIQQKIRFAHLLQWKRDFENSNILFDEIISVCRLNKDANVYLDFALQHAGKNFFDQNRLEEALFLFEEAMQIRLLRKAPHEQIESTQIAIRRVRTLLS